MTEEIPALSGQQPVIDALVTVASQPVSYGHAYLLSGADTIAVTAVAAWLRNFLVCATPVGQRSCGHCAGCVSSARGDGVWTLSVERAEGEQAHSVERIRSIRQFVGLKPVASGRRVVLVDSADTLRGPAANALLKNIEEPSTGLVYVLTAKHASAVLATIRSRAMSVAIQPVPKQELIRALVHAGQTRNAAESAYALFPGQAGQASQFLADPERLAAVRELEQQLTAWQTLTPAQRLRVTSTIVEGFTEVSAQRQRVHDALAVAAAKRTLPHFGLRALLNACLALRTNAQPKLIFDAFALHSS